MHCEDVDKPVPGDGEVPNQGPRGVGQPAGLALPARHAARLVRIVSGLGASRGPAAWTSMWPARWKAVGRSVTRFEPGRCRIRRVQWELFAEYTCASESKLIAKKPKPSRSSRPPRSPLAALTALQGLRDYGRIESGQNVLSSAHREASGRSRSRSPRRSAQK